MPPQELTFGDWNSDTATSTNIDIQGDTFTLATTAITSFEGDLSAFSGDTGAFETTTAQAYDGTQSLGKTADNVHDAVWLTDSVYTSGNAFTLSAWVYTGGDLQRGGPTLVDASTGNGYVAYIDPGNDLTIATVSPRFDSVVNQRGSLPTASTGWYRCELSHDGAGGISSTLYNYGGSDYSVSASDSSYSPNTAGANVYDTSWYADLYEEV